MTHDVRLADPLTISTQFNYFKPHIALFGAFSLRAFRDSGFQFCSPTLDMGCGDGLYGAMLMSLLDPQGSLVGIDYSVTALSRAAKRQSSPYIALLRGDVQQLPFENASFRTVFANGVLAAVPVPQSAMAEAYRVLRSGGEFCFTVRTHQFRKHYLGTRLLKRIGLCKWADAHSKRIDRRTGAMHVNSDPEQWTEQLKECGFEVTDVVGLYPIHLMSAWGVMSWLPLRVAFEVLRFAPSKRAQESIAQFICLLIGPIFRQGSGDLRPEECASILVRGRKP
jgi:ubiquinone/menaquinone biosynthesis C-methylase UbiE